MSPPESYPSPTSRGESFFGDARYCSGTDTAGPENVAGFRIFGNKGLVDSTFQPQRSQLRIVGHAVINRGFTSPAVARRLGFDFRQINTDTIELTRALR